MKPIKKQKGFTIIELLVVIAILTILLAIVIPNYIMWRQRAKEAAVINNMHIAQVAIESYAAEHMGNFPGTNVNWTLVTEATPNDIAYYFPPGWINNPYIDEPYNKNGVENFIPAPVDWTKEEIQATESDQPECHYDEIDAEEIARRHGRPDGVVNARSLQGAIAVLMAGVASDTIGAYPPDYDEIPDAYALVGWGQNPNSSPINKAKSDKKVYVVLWNSKQK